MSQPCLWWRCLSRSWKTVSWKCVSQVILHWSGGTAKTPTRTFCISFLLLLLPLFDLRYKRHFLTPFEYCLRSCLLWFLLRICVWGLFANKRRESLRICFERGESGRFNLRFNLRFNATQGQCKRKAIKTAVRSRLKLRSHVLLTRKWTQLKFSAFYSSVGMLQIVLLWDNPFYAKLIHTEGVQRIPSPFKTRIYLPERNKARA